VFKIQENHPRPIPVLDVTSQSYSKMKNTIVEAEKYLLKELGFELFRLTDHPQKYMINYVKMLRSRKETAQKAWYYCNDSFRKALCAHYPPNVIAVSCIYLALRVLNYPFVNVGPWWTIFEVSIKQILEVCAEIVHIYELPKITTAEAKQIVEKYRGLLSDVKEIQQMEIE